MIPHPEIPSTIFGPGLVRNATIPGSKYVEFSNHYRPRLWVWTDGTFSLSGMGGSCSYSGKVDGLEDLVSEIRRIHGELMQ